MPINSIPIEAETVVEVTDALAASVSGVVQNRMNTPVYLFKQALEPTGVGIDIKFAIKLKPDQWYPFPKATEKLWAYSPLPGLATSSFITFET